MQALGLAEDFRYDWLQETVMSGDVFLLCSDGLNDMLTDDQIRDILSTALPSCGTDTGEDGAERDSNLLSEACHALVSAAMDHGGLDNITVMLLCVDPCEGQD